MNGDCEDTSGWLCRKKYNNFVLTWLHPDYNILIYKGHTVKKRLHLVQTRAVKHKAQGPETGLLKLQSGLLDCTTLKFRPLTVFSRFTLCVTNKVLPVSANNTTPK